MNYKYILSVSGGVDSMVMLEMIYRKFGRFKDINKDEILVVTFDHNTRNGQSKKDALFVMEECRKRNIFCISINLKIQSYAKQNKTSLEDAGRILRYENLRKIKEKYNAEYILVAHHKDDLIETIIMKLIRGTFIKGLIGFEEKSEDIWRPLIDYRKADLYKMAREFGILWHEDYTNLDSKIFRNRVRNILLPSIRQAIPNIDYQLLKIREYVIDLKKFLDLLTYKSLKDLVTEGLLFDDWLSFSDLQKYWILSNLDIWYKDKELVLQRQKLENLIKRIDKLKSGKKVLLGHKTYPIIRKGKFIQFYP